MSVPPTFDGPPIPPGGVPILGQPQQRPMPTRTTVDFQMCAAGFYAILDEDDTCREYRFTILDPFTQTEYHFDFAQKVKDDWVKELSEMPNVGEKPDAGSE